MDIKRNDIPVIKTFIHNNKFYLYDTYNNRLINILKDHFIELKLLQKIGLFEYRQLNHVNKSYKDIIVLIDKGFLKPPHINDISHAETEYVEYLLDRCINDITLQVTRDCNFNCRYCLYAASSGIDRAHEKQNMSWFVAKRAIDYLYDHSKDAHDIRVSYYGGEPLINFSLIEETVQYIEKRFNNKNISYAMTINGSLLSEKVVSFLVKNDFNITISLDGIKEIHDFHRKFLINGNGTFDVVYANILYIKNRYPKYFKKRVSFNPVFLPGEDFDMAYQVFRDLGVDKSRVFVKYANLGGIDYIKSESQLLSLDNEVFKAYEANNNKRLESALANKAAIPNVWHHGGPCIPGIKCLFVDTNGTFYPCEKIIENEALSIGSLETGINIETVKRFLNIGGLSSNRCKKCWAIRFCDLCISSCIDVDKNMISAKQKELACDQQEMIAMHFLKQHIDAL